ncbi:MAG: cyanophycinase [Dokdonella sp.]|uniref:cyanophycinase n=1 Tax=Dokdonella sp. TaxID=2291710 RepID=UPI003BAE3198
MLLASNSRAFRFAACLIAIVLCGTAANALAEAREHPGFTYYSIGELQAATPSAPTPGLMLMGGGDWVDEAFRWFVERSGNGHIVIVRASGDDELQRRLHDDIGGVTSVQTFVFSRREAADDPFVIKAIERADGIFIAGGDQANYIRYWKGTRLNTALDHHVRQGKPLGGTSAGLAILGATSYGALDGGSITSEEALARPLGAAVTLDSGFLHLPFLDRIITDSHFGKRERLGRLIAFLAKAQTNRLIDHPIGLGIDENTALCIDGDGLGRLYSGSGGYAWLVRAQGAPAIAKPDAALSWTGIDVTGIGPGSLLNLRTTTIERPAFARKAEVRKGALELHEQSIATAPAASKRGNP